MNRLHSIAIVITVLAFSVIGSVFSQVTVSDWSSSNAFNLNINDPRPAAADQFYMKIFVRDSTYSYAVDEVNSDWVLESKRVLEYDNQGRSISSTKSILSADVWQRDTRNTYAYTADERLSSQLNSVWNPTRETWDNLSEKRYFYNYAGLENEITTLAWDGNRWLFSEQTEKSYTDFGGLEKEVHFVWTSELSNWSPQRRVLFTYEDELIVLETHQVWLDSLHKWANNFSTAYSYDNELKLIMTTKSVWNEAEAKYESSVSTILEYNEEGQLELTEQFASVGALNLELTAQDVIYNTDGNPDEVIHSEWDPDAQEWVAFKKLEHFWSHFTIGNISSRPSEISCSFANPYTIGLPMYCESLKKDVLYSVELYDQQGRFFYGAQFLGQHSFRINEPLPPGFYVVVIRGGLDVHTEKMIIRR